MRITTLKEIRRDYPALNRNVRGNKDDAVHTGQKNAEKGLTKSDGKHKKKKKKTIEEEALKTKTDKALFYAKEDGKKTETGSAKDYRREKRRRLCRQVESWCSCEKKLQRVTSVRQSQRNQERGA